MRDHPVVSTPHSAAPAGDQPGLHASPRPSIYQHPLAYLIGLEGVALMKAFAGEFDREFTSARLAEVCRLLDAADALGEGTEIPPMTLAAGYDGWAAGYDDPENGLFAIEERALHPILDRLPAGVAVDAACGTGRHAAYLLQRGHRVYGFDASPQMLAIARTKVPDGHFVESDLRSLPLPPDSVDVVVCALALAHVEHLEPVFREAARVLRPGGHFVISDTRGHFVGSHLYPLVKRDLDGRLGYIPTWRHATSAYLRAALPDGFLVRDCQELGRSPSAVAMPTRPTTIPPRNPGAPPDVWDLHAWAPEATDATYQNEPVLIVWDFELAPAST